MRVEIVVSPGCSQYKKTLSDLQMVIAEERLPIPVELTEGEFGTSSQIRVDGESLFGCETLLEELRNVINNRWSAHTSVIT